MNVSLDIYWQYIILILHSLKSLLIIWSNQSDTVMLSGGRIETKVTYRGSPFCYMWDKK